MKGIANKWTFKIHKELLLLLFPPLGVACYDNHPSRELSSEDPWDPLKLASHSKGTVVLLSTRRTIIDDMRFKDFYTAAVVVGKILFMINLYKK